MEADNPLDTHAMLPCPFCGRAATVKRDEFDLPMGRKDIMFFVECCLPECRNRTCNWFPLKAAVAAWNRRAHAPQGAVPAPGGVEALDLEAIEARAKKFAKRIETTTAFDDLTRHTKWFAACATTDIPALIAEVRRLRSALAKAEGKPA